MVLNEIAKMDDFHSKLIYLYENLDNDNMEEVAQVFMTPEFRRFVVFMISKKTRGEEFSKEDYVNLQIFVDTLQAIYNYSDLDTGVSDVDFDILFEILEDSDLDRITVPIKSTRPIGHHKYKLLRGSLEKVYGLSEDDKTQNKSRKGLYDWMKKQDNVNGVDISSEEVYVFPKWNGISVIHEFDENNNLVRSLSRGFTELNEAEIVTDVFKPLENRIKDTSPYTKGKAYGLKTEVIVSDEVFEEYMKKTGEVFKSARSLCNSIVRGEGGRENLLEIKKLRVGFLNGEDEKMPIVAEEAFNSPYIRCNITNAETIRSFANKCKKTEGCDCDGVVIYIIDEDKQKKLGYKDDKPNFEVAFKFNEEIAYTKMVDIEFRIGPLGRITPTAVFKPVVMKGNTITHASLGSYQRYLELGLRKGDTVKILYEIIPYLIFDENDPKCKHTKHGLFESPKECPECKTPFDLTMDEPRCENPECPCRKKGKILNYVRKMNIKQFDIERIYNLYDMGILTNIQDLYRLKNKKEIIINLPGFGEKIFNNMITDINSNTVVPASMMLGALGINGVGKSTFQTLLRIFSLEEVLEFAETGEISPFTIIRGIKERKAKAIIDGINENRTLISYLEKELTIVPEDTAQARFKVCFTKIRSKELEDLIKSKNGKVIDNVTKDCDILIVPNLTTESRSVEKAKEYGIKIIPAYDASKFISEQYR